LVHVVSPKALREFEGKHADAAAPLRAWFKLIRHGRFQNLDELKRTFASVGKVAVKGRRFYVFNIGRNNYRMIAAIHRPEAVRAPHPNPRRVRHRTMEEIKTQDQGQRRWQ
jgi:mRNA-degrading endonuclease HigB of HigAB toxin-antitoxin module